ncbi:hypothetical protein QR680_001930 [Steinernema hermaphroditum]|uniref:Uncharacterized protein n=1 Tax=Steinernema hermaphroditum TaxID=289476 RepID=A0AA39LH52_9BILA|nr:hypothetical protein QR680_001930 [Steinernema hermaphroditum]
MRPSKLDCSEAKVSIDNSKRPIVVFIDFEHLVGQPFFNRFSTCEVNGGFFFFQFFLEDFVKGTFDVSHRPSSSRTTSPTKTENEKWSFVSSPVHSASENFVFIVF